MKSQKIFTIILLGIMLFTGIFYAGPASAAPPAPKQYVLTVTPQPAYFGDMLTITGILDKAPTGKNDPMTNIKCYQNGLVSKDDYYNPTVIKNADGSVSLVLDWVLPVSYENRGNADCTAMLNIYSPKIKGYETVVMDSFNVNVLVP